jgi:Skp family chaperone for outer membrane proteins
MKKLLFLTLLFSSSLLFSQNYNEKLERVKALRVAYISEKLELTPTEAEKFWPVFNSYDKKQGELNKQKRELMKKLHPKNSADLSESELTKLMQEDEKIETDILNNKKQLAQNLQGVIPTKKILMLRKLEIEFKQKLLDKIKNRRMRN